ncbi:acyl-CoA dehydratase activase-related protein [Candidatus Formimonas warabiya]|uniref:DUF2229 domain-containing protein n=1 Tax=Formimonas warabiya TaxID=1761012 RepID=A0A3G1KNN8_FORW1|nr:acyl-CoA dehydratase activase-related protein [Candidatus Formimonas warabiya]ATW24083.1 hypothetical protein DCMF_04160 [Candidatus Formimonas warabiya]
MTQRTVGIPKGLLYHYYHTLWTTFFLELGFDIKVSPDTNKKIMQMGITSAVDEACLPVKVFYGHVLELADQVDYLFLPRMVSVARKEYMCPKLLGLPDMLRAYCVNPPPFIDVTVNLRNKDGHIDQVIKDICTIIQVPVPQGKRAWEKAEAAQKRYEEYLHAGHLPSGFCCLVGGYPIAVLGHGYNVYDSYINLGLIQKLRDLGADVHTKEMVAPEIVDRFAQKLPKKMFWTFGKQLVGSGLYYLSAPEIKGIIFLASFGCGPDSMVGELLERWATRAKKKPFMFLTIDEHSGEAGMVTRLEAFMDMIKRRVS